MKKIKSNIKSAHTLDGEFYVSDKVFKLVKEKIFETSWQFVCSKEEISESDTVFPFYFLENFIAEPLMLLNNNNRISCLSNVFTHGVIF